MSFVEFVGFVKKFCNSEINITCQFVYIVSENPVGVILEYSDTYFYLKGKCYCMYTVNVHRHVNDTIIR